MTFGFSPGRSAGFRLTLLALGLVTLRSGSIDAQAGLTLTPDLTDLARRGALQIEGRSVSYIVDGDYRGAHVSAARRFGVAWIEGITFSVGTIELDVRGKDVQSQSFLGLAIGGGSDAAYETVFLRPFNFRTPDPISRMHAIQYESMPTHPWSRLREESPEAYENPVDPAPDPDTWVHLRLVVEPERIHAFVGEGTDADLIVERIGPRREGAVGLWVGNFSDGDFANLRISAATGPR